MPYSYVQYVANGSTNSFNVPFGYLDKTHVAGSVDGAVQTLTWLTGSSVAFPSPPANGTIVDIRRTTPRTPLIDFSDGSVLVENDLDGANLQVIYIAQEVDDNSADPLNVETDGTYNAGNRRIKNLAAPTLGGDAVNKTYADGVIATAQGHSNAAAASAASAAASAGTATTKAAEASASAAAAAGAANTAANAVLAAHLGNPVFTAPVSLVGQPLMIATPAGSGEISFSDGQPINISAVTWRGAGWASSGGLIYCYYTGYYRADFSAYFRTANAGRVILKRYRHGPAQWYEQGFCQAVLGTDHKVSESKLIYLESGDALGLFAGLASPVVIYTDASGIHSHLTLLYIG